jgi:photosystem II stability/assembly factor-like uncharacterized protein
MGIGVSPAFRQDRLIFIVNGAYPNFRISRSNDGGQNWVDVGSYPSFANVRQFLVSPSFASDHTLFLHLDDSSLWRSLNGGTTWSRADDDLGLAQGNQIGHADVVRLADGTAALFVSTLWAVVVTFDAGQSWYLVDWMSLGQIEVTSGLIIYGLAEQGRLLRSTNLGDSWTEMLPGEYCYGTIASRKHIYDGTVYATCASGLWATHNAGASWERRSSDLSLIRENEGSLQLEVAPDFAQSRAVFAANDIRLLRSLDGGQGWQSLSIPPANPAMTRLAVSPQFTTDRTVFMTRGNQLYRSTNSGGQWVAVGQPFGFTLTLLRLSPNYPNDGTIFVGNYGGGIFRSTDSGQSWTNLTTQFGNFVAVTDLELSPSFATDSTIFINLYNDDIFRSTNGGQSWVKLPVPQSSTYDVELSPAYGQDQTVFAANTGSSAGAVYRSTNQGNTWTQIAETYFINSLAVSPRFSQDQTVFVSQEQRPLLFSEDAGDSWMTIRGAPQAGFDVALAYDGAMLYPLAATSNAVYKHRWPSISLGVGPLFIGLTSGVTTPVTTSIALIPDDNANLTWEASQQTTWLSLSPITGTVAQPLLATVDPQQISFVAATDIALKLTWSKRQSSSQTLPVLSFFVRDKLSLPMVLKSSPRYVVETTPTSSRAVTGDAIPAVNVSEVWPLLGKPWPLPSP